MTKKTADALEFITAQRKNGIELMQYNGLAILHADPGITPDQDERWFAMVDCVQRLIACRNEVAYLVSRGRLQLPKHPGWS